MNFSLQMLILFTRLLTSDQCLLVTDHDDVNLFQANYTTFNLRNKFFLLRKFVLTGSTEFR